MSSLVTDVKDAFDISHSLCDLEKVVEVSFIFSVSPRTQILFDSLSCALAGRREDLRWGRIPAPEITPNNRFDPHAILNLSPICLPRLPGETTG